MRDGRHHRIVVATLVAVTLAGCGGSTALLSDTAGESDHKSLNADTLFQDLTADLHPSAIHGAASWRAFLQSPHHYAGALVVRFVDGTDVHFDAGAWLSGAGADTSLLTKAFTMVPTLVAQRTYPDITRELMDAAQTRARAAGVRLHDWTQVYTIPIDDPAMAEGVLATLLDAPIVQWAHPLPVLSPASITIPTLTPGPQQTYLSNAAGSLNVIGAWDTGLTGQDQVIVDSEGNWNYAHDDLPLNIVTTPLGSGSSMAGTGLVEQNHGAGVIGILAATDDAVGVTGMAPAATIRTIVWGLGPLQSYFTSYALGKELGGQVVLVEIQAPFKTLSNGGCYVEAASGTLTETGGCLPLESYPYYFDQIADLVQLGVVVVEGAGNGAISLDVPGNQVTVGCPNGCPNLATQSTGAIMVGASEGPNMQRLKYSNCGTRVDAYAWGAGVVTTGYGDHPISTPGNPNQWYTQSFGGTSAATAMIGGAVALWQEHVEKITAPTLKPWQHAYLDSARVRQLIQLAGLGQSDGGCAIGKQPDVGAALTYLTNGTVQPIIADKGGSWCSWTEAGTPAYAAECAALAQCEWAGPGSKECAELCLADPILSGACTAAQKSLAVTMDLDGDGRSELVSWDGATWRIDRSGTNPTASADGFGQWDLVLTPASFAPGRVYPVLEDYNADGKADLGLYHQETGQWYIKFTDATLLAGTFGSWSTIVEYSSDPQWQAGSRPVASSSDGKQYVHGPDSAGKYWVAYTKGLVLVTPTGQWLYDYNDGTPPSFGTFDKMWPLLTADQLSSAPGWAYLPTPLGNDAAFKSPDGILKGERLYDTGSAGGGLQYEYDPIFGTNANIYAAWWPHPDDAAGTYHYGFKTADGEWIGFDLWEEMPITLSPKSGFGGVDCHPVVADYDGDGLRDRATLCMNGEWRVAYSGTTYPKNVQGFRVVELQEPFLAYPGVIHPGGIAYQDLIGIYEHYNFGCPAGTPCTIFDLKPPTGPNFLACLTSWANHPVDCLQH